MALFAAFWGEASGAEYPKYPFSWCGSWLCPGLLRALLKPDAISVLGHRQLTSSEMGLILMKPTGDNPAETFQDLWDGMG